MMKTGKGGHIELEDDVDLDGELQIELLNEFDWISREQAIEMIKHVISVFSLSPDDLR